MSFAKNSPLHANLLPLARLSGELDALPGITSRSPGYRKLGDMVRDGSISTVIIKGRHYVPEGDKLDIAQMLGMLPSRVVKPEVRAPHAAASVAA